MPSRVLSPDDEEWVKDVTKLSEALSAKLTALGGLSGESCGNIAHHLAEVCLSSRRINSHILPSLLAASSSDSEALATLSHDLMTELDEIRDGIESMSLDMIALMNSLNR